MKQTTKPVKAALIVLLAALMALAMAACGGGGSPAPPAGDEPAPPAADEPAPPADTGGDEGAEAEPLVINFSSTMNQAETGGQIIQHFIDNLGAISGGNITVNITWGGTLFDTMGEFDAVSDGAVNMVALGHMPHTGTLNYLGFPGFAPGGPEGAIDYFNDIMFGNPETSALVDAEAESFGIKYLNAIAGGANALCAKFEFTDLDSLVAGSAAFANFMPPQWESLGFHVVPLPPPDIYDAFNRGMCDATQMGLTPMVSLSWYEVAPYWALDGTYSAGNLFTVNLDWWNGLSAEQQGLIQQAATEVSEYSKAINVDAIGGDVKTIEDATGNAFVELGQADLDRLWASCFEATSEGALKAAEANGKADGMRTILEEAARFTGYDWQG